MKCNDDTMYYARFSRKESSMTIDPSLLSNAAAARERLLDQEEDRASSSTSTSWLDNDDADRHGFGITCGSAEREWAKSECCEETRGR